MDINEMKLKDLIEVLNLTKGINNTNSDDSHWNIGENYLIRTVTHAQVGRLAKVTRQELVLESAAWVADIGRVQNVLKNGLESESNSEIELFLKPVIIGRGAIVDAIPYSHKLPQEQK